MTLLEYLAMNLQEGLKPSNQHELDLTLRSSSVVGPYESWT